MSAPIRPPIPIGLLLVLVLVLCNVLTEKFQPSYYWQPLLDGFEIAKQGFVEEPACVELDQKVIHGFDLVKSGIEESLLGEPGPAKDWAIKTGIMSNASDAEIKLDCNLYQPDDGRIIYFLHIHKAAGSTLCSAARANNALSRYYLNCNIGNGTNRCCGGDSLEAHQEFAKTTRYKFVANEWLMYETMDTDTFHYVVVLRDSWSRLLSHFNMYKKRATSKRNFTSFVQGQPDNFITRMICGPRCLKRPKFQLTGTDLYYTVTRLVKFDSIILQEDFDRTYSLFASRVGWKRFPGAKNAKRIITVGSERSVADKILRMSMTAVDNALYEIAERLVNGLDVARYTYKEETRLALRQYFNFGRRRNCTKVCCTKKCEYFDPWGESLVAVLQSEDVDQVSPIALPTDTITIQVSKRSPILNLNPPFMIKKGWISYNPSILLLPQSVWKKYCRTLDVESAECQRNDVVLFTLFTRKPGEMWGKLTWMGATTLSDLRRAFAVSNRGFFSKQENWLVPPIMLQDVLGPELQDPRLMLIDKYRIALVAYTVLADISVIPGMKDYHVRFSVLSSRPHISICQDQNVSVCPPQALVHAGEFFIDCSYSSAHCEDEYGLYGVEIQRHPSRHIPQKNLVPIQFHPPLRHVVHFVDFSPPDDLYPLVYTSDMSTGELLSKKRMSIERGHTSCLELGRKGGQKWRGGTQVIQMPSGLWITVLHEREEFHSYKHHFALFSIIGHDQDIDIECIRLSTDDVFQRIKNSFYFAVGLSHIGEDEFLISFGRDNRVALVQKVTIQVD